MIFVAEEVSEAEEISEAEAIFVVEKISEAELIFAVTAKIEDLTAWEILNTTGMRSLWKPTL